MVAAMLRQGMLKFLSDALLKLFPAVWPVKAAELYSSVTMNPIELTCLFHVGCNPKLHQNRQVCRPALYPVPLWRPQEPPLWLLGSAPAKSWEQVWGIHMAQIKSALPGDGHIPIPPPSQAGMPICPPTHGLLSASTLRQTLFIVSAQIL